LDTQGHNLQPLNVVNFKWVGDFDLVPPTFMCQKKIKNQNKKERGTDYWGFPHPTNIDWKLHVFVSCHVSMFLEIFLEMQLEYNQIEDTVCP